MIFFKSLFARKKSQPGRLIIAFRRRFASHAFIWMGAAAATLVVYSQTPDFLNETIRHSLQNPQVIALEFIIPLLLIYFTYYASGIVWLSIFAPSLLLFAVSVINKYKVFLRGDPFMPADIILGGEVLNIASSSSITIGVGSVLVLTLIVLCCVAAGLFFRFKKERPAVRLAGCAVAAALCAACYFGLYANDAVYASIPIKHNEYNMVNEYNSKGFIFAFLHNIKTLNLRALRPEGYSIQAALEILARYGGGGEGGKGSGGNGDESGGSGGRGGSNGNGRGAGSGGNGESGTESGGENGNGNGGSGGSGEGGNFKPDVIVLMSEAFWDITEIDSLIFDGSDGIDDPVPNYHKLMEECVSGDLYVNVYGGGTDTTEFGFLTGHNIANFNVEVASAFKLLIRRNVDSIARTFKRNGYGAVAMHPGFPWFYNRQNVYPWLGFDEFIHIGSFDQSRDISGNYISDKAMTDKLIEIYAGHTGAAGDGLGDTGSGTSGADGTAGGASDTAGVAGGANGATGSGEAGGATGTGSASGGAADGTDSADGALSSAESGVVGDLSPAPLFCFTVSIQNHGPYDAGYMYGETPKNYFAAPGIELSIKSDYAIINYIQGLKDADTSLGRLIEYFGGVGRPVVFVFFGDHLPGLGRNFSAYRELGYPVGNDGGLKEKINTYKANYLIWANEPALRAWPEYARMKSDSPGMSVSYLGAYLLDCLGLERGAYDKLVESARAKQPVYHTMFHGTVGENGLAIREGNPGSLYGADPADGQNGLYDLIKEYKIVQHYKLFDEKP